MASDNKSTNAHLLNHSKWLPWSNWPNDTQIFVGMGTQEISKFNKKEVDTVSICLAIFRLPEFTSDIMISLNNPENFTDEHFNQFTLIVKSFQLLNTDLFE